MSTLCGFLQLLQPKSLSRGKKKCCWKPFVAINLDMHLFGFKFCFVTELKSRAIPLMSCSTGFILSLDLVFAATFLWPNKIHSLQGPWGAAGWETPCSAAGLGCLWIVYLVFGLSSPSQFCTKQGTLSFHTLKKYKKITWAAFSAGGSSGLCSALCLLTGGDFGWLGKRELWINTPLLLPGMVCLLEFFTDLFL